MDFQRLGARLRRAREQAQIPQADAARQLGMTPAALSQYESGKRRVDALTLHRLGQLYGVPLPYFFGDDEPIPAWEEALRARARSLSTAGKSGIASVIERVHVLEELYRMTDTPSPGIPHAPFEPLPNSEIADDEVANLVDAARRHFDLGVAPVLDARAFLENQGFHVFSVPIGNGSDGLAGLFFRHEGLGPIIVVNEDQASTRQPFTLAHEFAHSLFHYDRPVILCRSSDSRSTERFADRFASLFLIPPLALDRRWRELQRRAIPLHEQIVHLARYFGVSFQAMKRRLEIDRRTPLGIDLSSVRPVALARSLGYDISPSEFGRRPLPLEERLPRVYIELAIKAVREDRMSLQRAANLLGISDIELEERLYPEDAEMGSEPAEVYA